MESESDVCPLVEISDGKPLMATKTEQASPVESVPSPLHRQPTSVAVVVLLSSLFITADVGKMMSSYALRYYNNGEYPVHQTLLVALSEGSKCLVTTAVHVWVTGSFRMRPSIKFILPSVIYMLTNNIFFYALHFVTPPVWLVLVQCKVVLTLLVYKYVFKHSISAAQWTAGFLIVTSVLGSQLEEFNQGELRGKLIAVGLGLLCGTLSTIAAVYTEGLLLATIALATVQGITIAVVVRRLDNIIKYHLSATCSVLNSVLSAFLFPDKFRFTTSYIVSLFFLFTAIYLYEKKSFVLPDMCSRRNGATTARPSAKTTS
ncbi:hypothetical protein HPB47_011332 [Ixodes persulcatus]|uniref:Uncharacterized protein n=1 Tax=Ixodes persulcatus TaxID=34615 RepID=A0AC60NWM9_IXOPE|nr:hypothetical protein HPB47_011332 [Ixodes persulcatus]